MKTLNKFNITLPSKSANEAFARTAVAAFALQLDPTVDEISDIKTIVSEAVTNCIVHAYPNTTGNIYISAEIKSDNSLLVKIRDKGLGIEDVEKAMEPLYTTAGEERAGLGFAVMQNFSDFFKVKSAPGRGTTVIFVKKISLRALGNAGR